MWWCDKRIYKKCKVKLIVLLTDWLTCWKVLFYLCFFIHAPFLFGLDATTALPAFLFQLLISNFQHNSIILYKSCVHSFTASLIIISQIHACSRSKKGWDVVGVVFLQIFFFILCMSALRRRKERSCRSHSSVSTKETIIFSIKTIP